MDPSLILYSFFLLYLILPKKIRSTLYFFFLFIFNYFFIMDENYMFAVVFTVIFGIFETYQMFYKENKILVSDSRKISTLIMGLVVFLIGVVCSVKFEFNTQKKLLLSEYTKFDLNIGVVIIGLFLILINFKERRLK